MNVASKFRLSVLFITCFYMQLSHASDPYGVMLARSKVVALLKIKAGHNLDKIDNSYLVERVATYAGNDNIFSAQKNFVCACKLKIGSEYLAFIYQYKTKAFISGAYEVLGPEAHQAKRLSQRAPIVITADSSDLINNPLYLVGNDPATYNELFGINGTVHKVAINSWYPLEVVVNDIQSLYKSKHRDGG